MKPVGIDRDAPRTQRVFRQVEREAESVVKLERDIAGEPVAFAEMCRRFVEQFQAARQRIAEADFFELQRFGDSASARFSSG